MNLTVYIVARLAIVNAIAVAHSKPALGAIPPDRMLHEPRKHHWESRIEGAGIDPTATASNISAQPPAPVAGRAIGMGRAEPVQYAGAVQKVVNEGIDGDHAGPDLMPEPQLFWRSSRTEDRAMVSTLSETP